MGAASIATYLDQDSAGKTRVVFTVPLPQRDPVPLAEVSYGVDTRGEDVPFVGFTNGITRTIWLLTQGCTAFPIECDRARTQDLHRVAAALGTSDHTADEIAKAGRIASEQNSRSSHLPHLFRKSFLVGNS